MEIYSVEQQEILTKGQVLNYQIMNLRVRNERGLISQEELKKQLDSRQVEFDKWKAERNGAAKSPLPNIDKWLRKHHR